ncbi:hypothetical protein BOX15_Mlig008109g1 [Macrostomum lignano]|uniref:Uncharacterized protein n=2 Tax=Macrostomum lignano TaxID=282301 RepID=A0A267EZ46_9PLAT|nr:hypothetical protein BOX15_Mlig008109g1 [Macrostomum lignano]
MTTVTATGCSNKTNCSRSASALTAHNETDVMSCDDGDSLQGLLLRTRSALLRLRDCQGNAENDDECGQIDLEAALAEVNTWLQAVELQLDADGYDDELSTAVAKDQQTDHATISEIRTWTPDTRCCCDCDIANAEERDTASSIEFSLQSASRLIPSELLQRLDRRINQLCGQRGAAAAGKQTAKQPVASSANPRPKPAASLHPCLLARPPSAALSGRLLRGRGLIKTKTENFAPAQSQKQSRVPPLQRTLFSTLCSHPLQQQQQQQQQQSKIQSSSVSNFTKSKFSTAPRIRVMAVVRHNEAAGHQLMGGI